jgi:hypothetical protein
MAKQMAQKPSQSITGMISTNLSETVVQGEVQNRLMLRLCFAVRQPFDVTED